MRFSCSDYKWTAELFFLNITRYDFVESNNIKTTVCGGTNRKIGVMTLYTGFLNFCFYLPTLITTWPLTTVARIPSCIYYNNTMTFFSLLKLIVLIYDIIITVIPFSIQGTFRKSSDSIVVLVLCENSYKDIIIYDPNSATVFDIWLW